MSQAFDTNVNLTQASQAFDQGGAATAQGAREDLTDLIHNIAPTETPILTAAGSTTANGVMHEWQQDSLVAPGLASQAAEGADEITSGWVGEPTDRLGNYCMINNKLVRVTGTAEVVDKAGRDSEMAYQSALRARELKTDVDYTISTVNLIRTAGTANTAGQSRLAASLMLYAENTQPVGTTAPTPPTSFDGTSAWENLVPMTPDALDGVSDLDPLIQKCWSNGGKPSMIVMGPKQKSALSKLDGVGAADGSNVTRSDRAGRTIYATADVYVSNFGTLNVVPSRHMVSSDGGNEGWGGAVTEDTHFFVIDPEYLKIAYLRPWQQYDLAKTGDSVRRQMLVEWTLETCNTRAHGTCAGLA